MKSWILKTSVISLAFAAGLLVALPSSNANKAEAACSGSGCSGTNVVNPSWIKNCSVVGTRVMGDLHGGLDKAVTGTLHGSIYSSYKIGSHYPGCAQIIQINGVKPNKCYKITWSGTMDINCDGRKRDQMPWDAFFSLNTYNWSQAQYKASLIHFNGQPIANSAPKAIGAIQFNPSHSYTYNWYSGNIPTSSTTNGGAIVMQIKDANYIDNKGYFHYTIEKVDDTSLCPDAPTPTVTPKPGHEYPTYNKTQTRTSTSLQTYQTSGTSFVRSK